MIVVFGAAVRAGGQPSGALAGRIALARQLASTHPRAIVFCSGAIGREEPSEASVIACGLRDLVAPDRLVLDEESRDTLQTARAAAIHVRANGIARCIACTDNWHQPRARMLMRLFGVATEGRDSNTVIVPRGGAPAPTRANCWRCRTMRWREAGRGSGEERADRVEIVRDRVDPDRAQSPGVIGCAMRAGDQADYVAAARHRASRTDR
jgi:hypothetical protein